ncbi:MAG: desulfoferrodoxin [Selenomonadaceae bacterium]|nr:desulfoferrodoxin [Selenomonadaceae bacterium]MBR6712898.1 desulfoferrodoxin [Selenomonadaceae bacterium]
MSRLLISDDRKAIIMLITGGGQEISCGGKPMNFLTANTTDAAQEKHVPQVTVDGKKISVQVGSVEHPMTEAHLIQWIYLQTKRGGQYVHLTASDKPVAEFIVADDDEPIAAYEFCNLHGLWKADIA